MTVVRGGRGSQTLAAEEAAQQELLDKEEEQRLNDVRVLLQSPAFVRYLRYWIQESQFFTVAEVFSAEVYACNAKRAFGMRMFNQLARADKTRVVEVINLQFDKEHG